MAVNIVGTGLLNVQSKIQELHAQLRESPVPNFQAIAELKANLQALRGSASKLEADELHEAERRFVDYLRQAKGRLKGWVTEQLQASVATLDEAEREALEAAIDKFGPAFDDPALTTQLRGELQAQTRAISLKKLWEDTEAAVHDLWRQGEYSDVSTQNSLGLFETARTKSVQAQNDALERQAPIEVLDKFKALAAQATARYDDFRKRNYIPRTLDETFRFGELIERLESLRAEDPAALVDYYRGVGYDETFLEPIPVDKALDMARRRWQARVNEQLQTYISTAEASLSQHKPDEAREAINRVTKLSISSPESLLQPNPPLLIHDDLKAPLSQTLQKIAQGEQALKEFRATLNRSDAIGNPEESWAILMEAEQKYNQFVGRDPLWAEVRPRVLTRYNRDLGEQIDLTVGLLVAGNTEAARTLARTVEQKAGADQFFDEVRGRAARLLQLCDDVQNTVAQANGAIQSRKPDEMQQAMSSLTLLKQRMGSTFERLAQDGIQIVTTAEAALDIALNAQKTLAQLSFEADSHDDVDQLRSVLERVNSSVSNVSTEFAGELAALQVFLQAKIALTMGHRYKVDKQFSSALTELRKAEAHPRTSGRARELLSELQNIEEADHEVKKTLEDAPRLSPCDRVARLRSKLNLPSTIASELRLALREAEEQCSVVLARELAALKLGDVFDVQEISDKQELLGQTNPEAARRLNTRLAAIIADREARIHWEKEEWRMAGEKWQAAENQDQSRPILRHLRLAALKQAILSDARLTSIDIAEQVYHLEQRLHNDLPSDPDLLLALAELMRRQALDRTDELYELPTTDTDDRSMNQVMDILMRGKRMLGNALSRLGNWKTWQDDYEKVRTQMLSTGSIPIEPVEARLARAQDLQQVMGVEADLIRRKYSILGQLQSGTLGGFRQASKFKADAGRHVGEQST
jgi:hypothetical protein